MAAMKTSKHLKTLAPLLGCPSSTFTVPSPALKCSTHKTLGMINVVRKMSSEPGYCKQPSFNVPGQPALKCGTHKTLGMINVRHKKLFDVSNLVGLFGHPGQLQTELCEAPKCHHSHLREKSFGAKSRLQPLPGNGRWLATFLPKTFGRPQGRDESPVGGGPEHGRHFSRLCDG